MALTTTDRLLDDVVAVTLPDEGAGLVIGGGCLLSCPRDVHSYGAQDRCAHSCWIGQPTGQFAGKHLR